MGSPVIRKLKKESDFKEPTGSVKNKRMNKERGKESRWNSL